MSIRFSKSRASELKQSSDYTGCKAPAFGADAPLGINRVPAQAHHNDPTCLVASNRKAMLRAYTLQASSNELTIDNINMAFVCSMQAGSQGVQMDFFKRGMSSIDVPYKGYTSSINEELRKARCK